MESKLYNKDSWHYRLAKNYGLNDDISYGNPTNICDYIKSVVKGTIVAMAIALLVEGFVGSLVDSLIYLVFISVYKASFGPSIFGSIGLTTLGLIIFFGT